ncbi:MAG: hypothetical protein IKU29_00415 [Parabacteroides sp.]|nr:hypothetical protein [Parabacteroides sp.]
MNPKENISMKSNPFKFSDTFLIGFDNVSKAYDKKIEELNKVKSLIDKDAHHGVCACSYKMRYITPTDISTFISNLAKAMENHLFKPQTSDADLFAVESVKRFLKSNDCVSFDAPTIMGNPGGDIPKGANLSDLSFAAESECFGLFVYSKYELEKRAECMKKDADKLQNMHFTAAVRRFIEHLPSIMDKNATYVMQDSLLSKACEVYIEDFIMFSLRLNLTTVVQMLNYAIPRVAYKNEPVAFDDSNESANNNDNWDDDNEFFKMESVDATKASPIYFVFTKGKSPIISKAISKATDSDYTHISISFDSSLDNMYSFGGKGFRKESIHDDIRKNLDIDVYGTYLSNDAVETMKDMCADFISNSKKTKFDYPALVKKLFGSDKKGSSGYKEICTTFVNKLLNSAGVSLSDKNIPSPEEVRTNAKAKTDQIFQLYAGNSKDYNRKEASDKLKNSSSKESAKKFDEVVTECCSNFLKTNDYVITNKIPFNCNMRDIVLQDMHPQFKDTISALKFIMNDERSPIHQLLIQYYTEPIDDYDPQLVIKMFFGCCHEESIGTWNGRLNNVGMNTDVNWLDKITYGNMFLDGNYRRDGLGNQHTHPIMNTFDTIYKMFGGCDNVCDNAGLANSIIRISRVMKRIIEKYNEGCIPNWEMCRDILAVFGEIFTRHMLRLYYNNNHYLVAKDQMDDTVIPGYMYAESFVLEANGFTSDPNNNKSTVKSAGKSVSNVIATMVGWLRDKLSKFLPDIFKSKFQAQCKWFNENGQKKYDEIVKANEANQYNFPKKDKFYRYNVSFDPSKLNVSELISSIESKYQSSTDQNQIDAMKKELKIGLMNVFGDANKDKVEQMANLQGEELTKAVKNMLLFSKLDDEGTMETDYQINSKKVGNNTDFLDIFNNLKFMAKDNCKYWSDGINKLSTDLQQAINGLKSKYKLESFEIKLDKTIFQEMDGKPADPNNNENGEVKVNQEFAKAILAVVQEVATSVYTQTLNTVVTQLFPNNYNDFKGIVDDFDSTKKVEQTQTSAPAANNNPQGTNNAAPADASVNN